MLKEALRLFPTSTGVKRREFIWDTFLDLFSCFGPREASRDSSFDSFDSFDSSKTILLFLRIDPKAGPERL